MEGFRAGGGGFLASDSSESLWICANVSFGGTPEDVVGLADRGDGDCVLLGSEEPGLRAGDLFIVADVADFFTGGRFTVAGEAAFCSNIPIKDVVGGIGVVSKATSELFDEAILLTEGVLVMKVCGLLVSAFDTCDCPVGFGLTEADLEAANVAAMNEADLD